MKRSQSQKRSQIKKGIIKVRTNYDRLEVLYDIYERLIAEYVPTDEHERLLQQCAVSFWDKIDVLLNKRQDIYHVAVSAVEAMAFLQIWQSGPMAIGEFEAVIINETVAKIDGTRNIIKQTRLIKS